MELTLTLAVVNFVVCTMLVISAYGILSARMVRNPAWLLGMGLVLAAIAIIVKGAPLLTQAVLKGNGSEGLDIAAATVDPTLVALAGGLIASAFILKVQILRESKIENLLAQSARLEKMIETELSRKVFTEAERAQRFHELLRLKNKAEEELHKLQGPGNI